MEGADHREIVHCKCPTVDVSDIEHSLSGESSTRPPLQGRTRICDNDVSREFVHEESRYYFSAGYHRKRKESRGSIQIEQRSLQCLKLRECFRNQLKRESSKPPHLGVFQASHPFPTFIHLVSGESSPGSRFLSHLQSFLMACR